MRNIARNNCQKIKGCPASQYLACEAYKLGLECWQVEEPRCTSEMRFCLQYGCPVYDRYPGEIEQALKARAMERR